MHILILKVTYEYNNIRDRKLLKFLYNIIPNTHIWLNILTDGAPVKAFKYVQTLFRVD